jgi:hypothetical protein
MSRFPRLRRPPDQFGNTHERAMTRLAQRMDGPLGLAESTWLDEHLAGCPICTAVANEYEDDRLALRALREQTPEPPRDLWARTSAAIEATGGRRPARRAGRSVPIGALSGITVVALVVGVSLMSGGTPIRPVPAPAETPDVANGGGSSAAASLAVEPTPFAVGAGDVAWVVSGPNGVSYSRVGVATVCPVEGAASCPRLDETNETVLAFRGTPRTIIGSPGRKQAVAIARSADAGESVIVVALPEETDSPTTSAPPSAEPPSATPAPSPSASASTSHDPTSEPPASPSSAPSASPSVEASAEPSVEPSVEPSAEASILASQSPEASAAAEIAIASGIEVVGESAAFSADGAWFAFTARPADGSGAPQVYVWHVGDDSALPLTDDGASHFASWSDNDILASRAADPDAAEPTPRTVRIDPATGEESDAGDLWRPAVDPTGRLAIAWAGTIEADEATGGWRPAEGTLELHRWTHDGPAEASGSASDRVVTDDAGAGFDVRWDETGEWVAVWIADARDPEIGRLTLYRVDRAGARLEVVEGAPSDVPALPGFSIGDGRLAWASPPGQGGEGSRIQIAAWSAGGVGIVEGTPGEDIVVIR